MNHSIEILPLRPFTLEEILPIVTGYETSEQYLVNKVETDEQTVFTIRLIQLETPYITSFEDDFNDEDFQRYLGLLPQGYSFGAYHQERLVAFAISEAISWNNTLRVWEFQVMEAYRMEGIGRALMQRVLDHARQKGIRQVFLETQNKNVNAVRFYRKMGFSLDSLDISFYGWAPGGEDDVAFFMKQNLS